MLFAGLFAAAAVNGCSREPAPATPAPSAATAPSAELIAEFDALLSRITEERRQSSPQAMAAALAGSPRETEFLGLLDVPSVALREAELAMARRHRAALAAFADRELPHGLALSRDILAWTLDQQIAGAAFLWHDFPVNQLMAVHNQLPSFMTGQHPLRRHEDIEAYLARLARFPEVFEGHLSLLRHQVGLGILPPRFALQKTIRDSRGFIAAPLANNPLVQEPLARLARADWMPEDQLAELERRLIAAVEAHVVPAYSAFAEALEALLPLADSNDGVWRLPNGAAYYRWVLRGHTTTELDPEEIHALGLAEVARIEAEMDAILCDLGRCLGSVGARMAALNAEAEFLFEDSDAGREAILEAYRAIVAEAEAALPGWFHQGPAGPVEVQRVPVYREATAFGAYYLRPAGDGSRPGRFFVNLRNVAEHPRFGLRTLAYHEAIPGHHLQISRQLAMTGVPEFRRTLSLHAHAEGWALYAERLAWEMGLLEDPYDDLGRLQAELFRAARLVVDTGMHALRWSREQGIDYLRRVTGMPESDLVAEIERYLVIPGQACAFKVGMIRMLAMRERAQAALGPAFDLRDFHRVILDHGAMPLDLLDAVVDRWIAAGGG